MRALSTVYDEISHAPDNRRDQVGDDGRGQRRPVVVLEQRGQADVDAERDQGGPGDLGSGRDDDDHERPGDLAAQRAQQRPEQAHGALAQLARLRLVEVVALFSFNTGDAHFATPSRFGSVLSFFCRSRSAASRASSSSRLEMTKR